MAHCIHRWARVVLLLLAIVPAASAFIPPPCDDDPSRTIFAGFDEGPCKDFHGDQASCELAYYLNGDGEPTSCAYIHGTCIGCGGNNLVCPTNTCSGVTYQTVGAGCAGDPGRTSLLGTGDNGSKRCRNLDQTDQATCENAYYEQQDDDDLGTSVACFWSTTTGNCVGCGDNGSACPFNTCDPTLDDPDAECTLDSGRTNLVGFGGNGSHRCRHMDGTDAATCNSSFYEDDDSGLPIACWWDGDECRGSGFDDYFAYNSCLSNQPPPPATATCRLEPARSNLLGFGNNDTGACRQLDDTDQATCENAYYEEVGSGSGVACWWTGNECRGSFDENWFLNSCQVAAQTASATCAGRGNLLGFGNNNARPCHRLDDTDEATCEDSFYQSISHGLGVACTWNGSDCEGCGGQNEDCSDNPCIDATCAGDPTRTNLLGFGRAGEATCRQLDDTDEATCEDAFYINGERGAGVACWWDGDECRGSSRSHSSQNECRIDAVCTREPDRATYLGFGNNNNSPCRSLDGTSQAACEDAYYEDSDSAAPVACWWALSDVCLGSSNNNQTQNACMHAPATPSVTCSEDPSRATLIGFGHTHSGQDGGACRSLDGTDEATCADAFYEDVITNAPVACWWDGGVCRGSADGHAANNACTTFVDCSFDPSRTDYLGQGGDGSNTCRDLDATDQATCEAAYYESVSGAPAPVACWWDGENCRGSVNKFDHNSCLYDLPLRAADAACGSRSNLLGFGENSTNACRGLDGTDAATCEDAFYENDDSGFAIACWWNGSECRGSSNNNAENNSCPVDGTCTLDPGRSNLLGFGDNSSHACRQLDDSDESTCEDAFYINNDDGQPVACWWTDSSGDCRGSSSQYALQNACLRAAPSPATCTGRSTSLGFGNNSSNVCRQLDETSEATCEDAFYVHEDDNGAIACIWSADDDNCYGTTIWPALNACDPSAEPPACDSRTSLGKGGRDQAPCRQFDGSDESTCEASYYVSPRGEPIACWWDGGTCRGTNRVYSSENACIPPLTCAARSNLIGFGGNSLSACGELNDTDQATCEDAYYVVADEARTVACHWNAAASDCEGCNRLRENSTCTVNACDPIECSGDTERTRVRRCLDINSQSECEEAWHITGDRDFAPIAAACFWSAEEGECRGCGPKSQSSRECSNVCEDGCGNGVLDNGETCDDGNMYDGDCCDSTCQLEPDDSPCTDRLFCTTGVGTCQSGVCTGGTPRDCASCLGGDCDEADNECAMESPENGPAVAAAQLQGVEPPSNNMSFPLPPGTDCDDGIPGTESVCNGNGQCVGELVVSTMTPTSTPSPTNTGTPTATPSITQTPVPVGGPCAETAQCVDGAACVEGFCAIVAAPAPVASNRALLAIVVALLAVAAFNLHLRQRRS